MERNRSDRLRFFTDFVDPMLAEATAIGIPVTEILAYIVESAGDERANGE
ncbi:hypothetical protein [Amycolatopsis sp. YIM 10]|nr:hypothetical protein [Amycolatopsis sp. YIM 10]QFU89722.1 hypothetical protein YIM_22725 [Amycolatopsis sp. YIM 10]